MVHFSKIGFNDINSLPDLLPRYYGGVILVGVGSFAMHLFLGSRVMKARKEIGFPSPDMYHPTDKQFNCIQRAHQNYLENIPFFLSGLFIGGLFYPGYISGVPIKRRQGAAAMLSLILMMLANSFFGASQLYASFRQPEYCPMLESSTNLL
nr:microsomal glutathione S transferase [Hymenolepis microstoma]